MNNIDPTMIIQMIKNGNNPQQLVLSMLDKQAESNPMLSNLLDLAKHNKTKELESIARNLFHERGLDYDEEFKNFKQKLGV